MNSVKENIAGWIGSLLFHVALLILFFLLKVPEITQQEQFVEMSWGVATSIVQAAPASASSTGELTGASTASLPSGSVTQTISPPERLVPDVSPDPIRIPRTEKLTSAEASKAAGKSSSAGVGERETAGKLSLGEKEAASKSTVGDASRISAAAPGLSGISGDIDHGVTFDIQWLNGGTRRKTSGDLPRYPEGVNVGAQIKILAVIMPNGRVKEMQPAQKANTRLEDAAMREVRQWRFEPLRSSQPQVEQRCEITFLFTLK